MKKQFILIPILFTIVSVCHCQAPILWGMTKVGGGFYGNIFKINSNAVETNIFDFYDSTGSQPDGSLMQANNGLLYGMTGSTIFSYDIFKSTETTLHNINCCASGSFFQASNGFLYGLTSGGGKFSSGILFSYNIKDSVYSDVYDFDSLVNDGGAPNSSVIQANDSLLYGTTPFGGIYFNPNGSDGTIFSYNILTGKYRKVYNFGSGTDGINPFGSLIQADDGLLYGMTENGGIDSDGIIFSYDILTNKETDLHDFGNDFDGKYPSGSLIQANNGLLYGMTDAGGIYDSGTIFSYNITTGEETDLFDFRNDSSGYFPGSALMQASNGLLYGVASSGGVNIGYGCCGTIFSYDISTNSETAICLFNEIDGFLPTGSLIEVDTPTAGINQLLVNNNKLSIFPNPTSGQFTIKLNGNQNGYIVGVYNVMGEQAYQSVLSNAQNSIDLSNQPAGMYFVYLKSGEGMEVGKVMITK